MDILGLSEEEQLALALSESARAAGNESVLRTRLYRTRGELPPRVDKHGDPSLQRVPGHVVQFNTLNQFSPLFDAAKREHSTAAAICGYLSCAVVLLLEERLSQASDPLTVESVEKLVGDTLCNMAAVEAPLRKCMRFIQKRRSAYWRASGTAAGKKELMLWVANYEISDCLKHFCSSPSDRCGKANRLPSAFVRYNQWPCRGEATADESERLEEERRFGGVSDTATSAVAYGEKDSVFFIECFDGCGGSTFYTPEEWESCMRDSSLPAAAAGEVLPRIVVIDLQGHFVAALSCVIDGEKHLFIFNTTQTNYLDLSPAIPWAFDSMLYW